LASDADKPYALMTDDSPSTATCVDVDPATGRALAVERIRRIVEHA
jgi:hypothetical protein